MQDYTKLSFKTKTYYKNIVSLEFIPTECIENLHSDVKAGERYWWKFLGFIPIIPLKAKEDLYIDRCFGTIFSSKYKTLGEINDRLLYNRFVTKEGLFRKAYVRIARQDSVQEKYFDSNNEAYEFMESLKKKCKECGNPLS